MGELNMVDIPDDLTPGQQAIIDSIKKYGGEMTADCYAYLNFGRDIDDLTDEELMSIPEFLLDPWLAEHEEQER